MHAVRNDGTLHHVCGELVTGAPDPHRGYSRLTPPVLHPKTRITSGILTGECSEIVKQFFKAKRS